MSEKYIRAGDRMWGGAPPFDLRGRPHHREDGPAYEGANGTKAWYRDGSLHREDGPAVEWPNGTREWFEHGQYHRLGGPALEYEDGHRIWFQHGRRIREELPPGPRAR